MLDHIELVFKWLEEFNLKIKSPKMSFLPVQHSIPQAHTICRGYICKSQEGRISEELAGANKPKRITIILGVGLL